VQSLKERVEVEPSIISPGHQDKEKIIGILSAELSPKYLSEMTEELEKVINGNEIGFMAFDVVNKKAVGYITCVKTTKTYKLETMAVDHNTQGKGIGKKLVSHLEEYLQQNVLENLIVLNVVTDNSADDPVQNFYKRCGFSVSGIVRNEYALGDEQVHLSKILSKKINTY